jgi:hypothetical protein
MTPPISSWCGEVALWLPIIVCVWLIVRYVVRAPMKSPDPYEAEDCDVLDRSAREYERFQQ